MGTWGHEFIHIRSRGRLKVVCRPCAIASPWFELDEQQAISNWTTKHGLREKQHRSEHHQSES